MYGDIFEESIMSRFLLILLLMSPATANEPTIDQMLSAYAQAGWVQVQHPSGSLICIDASLSPYVDRVVFLLAQKARGVRCS